MQPYEGLTTCSREVAQEINALVGVWLNYTQNNWFPVFGSRGDAEPTRHNWEVFGVWYYRTGFVALTGMAHRNREVDHFFAVLDCVTCTAKVAYLTNDTPLILLDGPSGRDYLAYKGYHIVWVQITEDWPAMAVPVLFEGMSGRGNNTVYVALEVRNRIYRRALGAHAGALIDWYIGNGTITFYNPATSLW